MRRSVFILIALFFVVGAHLGRAGGKLRVKGNGVCLRARPDREAKTLAQVNHGDILESAGDSEEGWFAVVPPPTTDLWVYGELIRDGVVSVSRLRVRGGPGVNYRDVGVLTKGQKVTVRGQYAEWLKIAPPAQAALWINADFVTPVADPKPRPAPRPKLTHRPEPRPKPAVRPPPPKPPVAAKPIPAPIVKAPPLVEVPRDKPERTPLPTALIGRTLVESRPQGHSIEYVGVMRPSAPVPRRPSRYRLVRYDAQGRARTICYVVGNDRQLASIVGRTMLVSGREYWIQGVRYPAVAIVQMVRKD
jgi:hypothetical protein